MQDCLFRYVKFPKKLQVRKGFTKMSLNSVPVLDSGPSTWKLDYPQCAGSSQSPISVDTSSAVLDKNLTAFTFSGYDSVNNVSMSMKNNGHTGEGVSRTHR